MKGRFVTNFIYAKPQRGFYSYFTLALIAFFGLWLSACSSTNGENPPFCDWDSAIPRYYTDRPASLNSIKPESSEPAHMVLDAVCFQGGSSFSLKTRLNKDDISIGDFREVSHGVLQGQNENGLWTISRIEGGMKVELAPRGAWQGRQDLLSSEGIRLYPSGAGDAALITGFPYPDLAVDRIEWWSCEDEICTQNPFGEFLLIEEDGNLLYVDHGSPIDGPAYLIDKRNGQILGYCGGLIMAGINPDKPCDSDYWKSRLEMGE